MSIRIRKPDDFHVHFRQGSMMPLYVKDTAAQFARAVVMPNTVPPITTPAELARYAADIENAAPGFTPLMTFSIQPWMKESHLRELKSAGAVVGKLYPRGATTNSESGVEEIRELYPTLQAMERCGLLLSIHGEDPAAPVLDRETAFLPVVKDILRSFPGLKVVFEHISTAEAMEMVLAGPENLAGTVTAHHLILTLDDLMGGSLYPHLFCKPVVKTAEDREAIREGVFSGSPKLFFGSDSAPHPRESKQAAGAAAGVYSAPVALALLAELFEQYDALGRLEDFTSRYGAEFYGLPLNSGTLLLKNEFWKIPAEYHGVMPLYAERNCAWRVISGVS